MVHSRSYTEREWWRGILDAQVLPILHFLASNFRQQSNAFPHEVQMVVGFLLLRGEIAIYEEYDWHVGFAITL